MPVQAKFSHRRGAAATRWIAIGLGAVVVVGGALAFSRKQGAPVTAPAPHAAAPETATKSGPTEVGVETVSLRTLREPVRVTGTVRSDETVKLSTKASGTVRAVYAKEGDRVPRGKLLVVLDDTDVRAQRDRAIATQRAAEARLAQAITQRGIRNSSSQSEYHRAEQALNTARTRLSQAKSLADITDAETENRVTTAKSAVQSAKERLKTLQEGSRKQELATAQSSVTRAETQVNRMKSALDRREQLLRQGAIAAEAVDNARRDFEVSQADLDAAKQQLSLVQEGPRGEEIRVGEEAVRQAEAALRDAEANRSRRKVSREDIQAAEAEVSRATSARDTAKDALASAQVNNEEIRNARATVNQARADVRYQDDLIQQTRIFAPVSGVVTERAVHVGESVVQMRNDLMTLVSLDTLYFEATAPETALPSLRVGQRVEVSLDATPGRTTPGVLREIIPVASGTNRSVRLRISLVRPEVGGVKQVVGGFARAVVGAGTAHPVLSVPRTALASDEGQLGVFVVEDGKAKRREIQVSDAGGVGDRLQVLSGLRAGEKVVIRGAESLTNGQPVAAR